MTIKEAIKEVMRRKGKPMTAQEAYDAIVKAGLYVFNASIPSAVVRVEIRRHCLGVDFPSASKTKHFELIGSNKYYYIDPPRKLSQKSSKIKSRKEEVNDLGVLDVRIAQQNHLNEFKDVIIKKIKNISPENFEHFTKNLLEAYGFEDVEVSPFSKDRGIDGAGQMKVGLGLVNVAFQCKRYTSKSVSTKEVQEFRGSIQGKCEQGLFFTTSRFTKDCKDLMFQAGAVPIIMIDGDGIVDIMIDKGFGVQTENIPVYNNALDLAFSND